MNQILFLNQFTKPILHQSLSLVLMCSLAISATARAETPQSIIKQCEAQSKQAASPNCGRVLFTTNHGRDWSCSSCHGNPPTQTGKHASTGKRCTPLAAVKSPSNCMACHQQANLGDFNEHRVHIPR